MLATKYRASRQFHKSFIVRSIREYFKRVMYVITEDPVPGTKHFLDELKKRLKK